MRIYCTLNSACKSTAARPRFVLVLKVGYGLPVGLSEPNEVRRRDDRTFAVRYTTAQPMNAQLRATKSIKRIGPALTGESCEHRARCPRTVHGGGKQRLGISDRTAYETRQEGVKHFRYSTDMSTTFIDPVHFAERGAKHHPRADNSKRSVR